MSEKVHCNVCDQVMVRNTTGYDMPLPPGKSAAALGLPQGEQPGTARVKLEVQSPLTGERIDVCQADMGALIKGWAAVL